jgi:hypothetical protein
MDWSYHRDVLERAGVVFQSGLTAEEVERIERRHGFRFPPDYRAFLMQALPGSHSFIDWRSADDEAIRSRMELPFEDMCFDIENKAFWLRGWGPRPARLEDAFAIARRAVGAAPKLVPIAGHRFIPESPHEEGNPVFSVHQTDIIYYGSNLAEYLENEWGHSFFGQGRYMVTEPVKSIDFWSYLVQINFGEALDGSAAALNA